MSSWKWFFLSFFGMGIAFWIPDVVIAAFDPNEQGGPTRVACPIVLILFYTFVLRLRKGDHSGPSTAFFAICGMWVLSLWFAMMAQTFRGNGFKGLSWGELRYFLRYLLISSFVPTRIFDFVTLEGSIVALAIGTAAMVICHLAFERSRWILPPSFWAALRHAKPGSLP
jgi:hypothetical protein